MFSATEKDKTIKEVAKAYRVVNRSRSTPCIQETMSLHNTTVVELYVEAGQQSESTGYSGGSIKDTEKAPQKESFGFLAQCQSTNFFENSEEDHTQPDGFLWALGNGSAFLPRAKQNDSLYLSRENMCSCMEYSLLRALKRNKIVFVECYFQIATSCFYIILSVVT
ncbi:Claudin-16 [Manis javanica]|nr:Claudin-16 [Manis javanica]